MLRESHQGEVASLREAVDRARGELDTRVTGLQRELEAARERAEALQRADDARKARGLLARLRAAVRGSR